MERCVKCIMPLESIEHGAQGVCTDCERYQGWPNGWDSGRGDLLTILRESRRKGRAYDFMVPLTGGKDSVFALYFTRRLLPDARILAFTWDHGFHRAQSWKNIDSAVKATGVDHIVHRIVDEAATYKLFRGYFELLGIPCAACMINTNMMVLRAAIQHRIPLIIIGSIEGQWNKHKMGAQPAFPLARRQLARSTTVLRHVLQRVLPDQEENIVQEIIGPIQEYLDDAHASWPSLLEMGWFINWNLENNMILKQLREAVGFVSPGQTMTHTSCELGQLRGYVDHKRRRLGLDRTHSERPPATAFEKENSTLVRCGAIARNEALRELELLGQTDEAPDVLHHFLGLTGTSVEEFETWTSRGLPLST